MSLTHHLPAELAAALKQETDGELIRWAGQPTPCGAFRAALPIWIMGIPWSVLTVTIFGILFASIFLAPPPDRVVPNWEYVAMGAALIFIGVFTAIGLAMLAAPFFTAWQSYCTVHAITDKRLITVTAWRTLKVKSIPPGMLKSFERKEGKNGRGTLKIVTGFTKDSDGDTAETSEFLVDVPQVAAAEKLLLELQGRSER